MKMNRLALFAVVVVALTSAAIFAQTAGKYYSHVFDGNALFNGEVHVNGDEVWGSSSSVALTSPTVTWAVPSNARLVSLTADANLTGIYPTGGSTGQVITVISGAGSNTMRFDDGANTILGANVTLTEGQSDILTLYNNGSAWVGVSAHDN